MTFHFPISYYIVIIFFCISYYCYSINMAMLSLLLQNNLYCFSPFDGYRLLFLEVPFILDMAFLTFAELQATDYGQFS